MDYRLIDHDVPDWLVDLACSHIGVDRDKRLDFMYVGLQLELADMGLTHDERLVAKVREHT